MAFGLGCDSGAEQTTSREHDLAHCVVVSAGDGFVHLPLPDATALANVKLAATPDIANIDAVIGLSRGPAEAFSDLATAIRFAPSGLVDVRNGADYGADVAVAYDAGVSEAFQLTADLGSHTYSVLAPMDPLARGYRFRTTQSAVDHLDTLSIIVDSSEGNLEICNVEATPSTGIAYGRFGRYRALALPGDHALISDGETTERLDAAGRTIAAIPRGGALASDHAGNVFVARVERDAVALYKYNPNLVQQWRATAPIAPSAGSIAAVSVAPSGAIMVGVDTASGIAVVRFTASGSNAGGFDVPARAFAFDGEAVVAATTTNDAVTLTRRGAEGVEWTRQFAGSAEVSALIVDPSGAILFGGELFQAMSFGGEVLPLFNPLPGFSFNAFVVKLTPAGDHVFSRKTGDTLVGGIAINATRLVVSGTEWGGTRHPVLHYLDPMSGASLAGPAFDTGLGTLGVGRGVALSASGRVWWSFDWHIHGPFLVAVQP